MTPDKKNRPPAGSRPAPAAPWTWAAMGGVCLLVIVVFCLEATSGPTELWGTGAQGTYYNLLVDGFRAGQLNLQTEVPGGLEKLADPCAPGAAEPYLWLPGHPLHDLSYYHGKLYLYFGVTPALLLFWPYEVLTGHYLLHKTAGLIFCSIGFLAGAALLWALWQRYFPEISVLVVAAGALALGLATGGPVLLSRCDVYEVAISCGGAFVMLSLGAVWLALHRPERRGWWLAAASAAYGLALGARPSLLFGAVILLVPVVLAWRERRRAGVLLLAALGPVMVIGLGLLLYNARRFGDPFEFGQRFQIGTPYDVTRHFSGRYLWFNFCLYFLHPVHWSGYFPFVRELKPAAFPSGHGAVEFVFGVLTNIPFMWLALAAPLAWRGRLATHSILRTFLLAVTLWFGVGSLTLCLYYWVADRFEVEFLVALELLAAVGVMGLEQFLAGRPVFWRRAARCGWGLLLAGSVAFNLLQSVERRALVHNVYGYTLQINGRMDEAAAEYQKALDLNPDFPEVHRRLAAVFAREGKPADAIKEYEAALRFDPNSAEAHNALGIVLGGQGRLAEAADHFRAALKLDPADASLHCNLGNALAGQGNQAEAVAEYLEALRLNPNYAHAENNLAGVLDSLGRMDEALAHYQAAVRLEPDAALTRYNFGCLLVKTGRRDEAVAQLQEAVRLRPDYAEARHKLAELNPAIIK